MKLAIISDTHFGDAAGTMVARTPSGRYIPGPKYDAFRKAAGTGNDYLILNGDILDFAMSSYDVAYKTARTFFRQIQRDRIAGQIVYVPGNHDLEIWQIVEHEVNIIYQMTSGQMPRGFRMSVPGFIDDRKRPGKRGLVLPGVKRGRVRGKLGYGGLFLDQITAPGPRTRFTFAYPNLYLVTDDEALLVTHGHYIDGYWSALSTWLPRIFGHDIAVADPMSLGDMVAINFPSTQLACSGIGQAGVLTDTIHSLQNQIQRKEFDDLNVYLERVQRTAEKAIGGSRMNLKRWIAGVCMAWARKRIVEQLGKIEDPRETAGFIHRPAVRERLRHFYEGSAVQIEELNRQYANNIPDPTHIIIGHTHQPVPWKSAEPTHLKSSRGRTVLVCNTGGWLMSASQDGTKHFNGAEVFSYETGKGFSSESIQ